MRHYAENPNPHDSSDDPDAPLRIDTRCIGCGGSGCLPVTEDDGDRTYETGTMCLRCVGTGEDPDWRERATSFTNGT